MSFAEIPVCAASSLEMSPLQRAQAFLAAAQSAAADGLTWHEFGELLVGLLRTLVAAYDDVAGMDGAAKKALVMEAAGQLFDLLADRAVPLVMWPLWMLCRPAIRSLVLALASGAVEQILPLVRGA